MRKRNFCKPGKKIFHILFLFPKDIFFKLHIAIFDLIRNKRDIIRSYSVRATQAGVPSARMNIPYNDDQVVFAIPLAELNINPLIQNPGY